ncbi:bidirectional sugar transporter SWEET17-like [Papaver somniferum]|uniref:bidirectional sugar transporter SWEET17-like n=1 Tax=Papaver somniferum TaxID=3469 RepID=UPI000E703F25|nr:bidirectional sugar transporter SWEET17-like [Papaver somniferum]
MAALSISFIVGVIGNIISILVFLSPITTFRGIVKKKATENFKGIPYICTLLSTSLWAYYGLLKPDGMLIVTVNGAGAVLQVIYVTLFIIYAPRDSKIKHLKLVGILNVGFYGAVLLITLLATHGSLRLTVVGFICAGFTLGMYGAPLGAMKNVVVTKSVEYMPFMLTFFLFLNGGIWSVYSLLIKDFFIGVPNAIGFVLGSVQLIMYIIYNNKSKAKKLAMEKLKEEGSAHLVNGAVKMNKYNEEMMMKKERSLNKGWSLPTPTVLRQLSLQKIVKSLSANVDFLPLSTGDDDVENQNRNLVNNIKHLPR